MAEGIRKVEPGSPAPAGTVKVKDGEIQKWDAGLEVEGTLVDLKEIVTQFGPGTLAVFEMKDGKKITFGCPGFLRTKLDQVGMFKPVIVRCNGKKETKNNQMAWDFDVFVKGAPAGTTAGAVSTDADIPF